MMDRRLALAALDPNAAIAAAQEAPRPQAPTILVPRIEGEAEYQELVLSVAVEQPRQLSWWRFAVFWLCIKLASRVCKFSFEIKKTEDA